MIIDLLVAVILVVFLHGEVYVVRRGARESRCRGRRGRCGSRRSRLTILRRQFEYQNGEIAGQSGVGGCDDEPGEEGIVRRHCRAHRT